jgi:site-specific DNA-cytosine methylase
VRRLTPVECERLQGFPDNWTAGISDSQRYKSLGNAVSVPVVKAVFEQLRRVLMSNFNFHPKEDEK